MILGNIFGKITTTNFQFIVEKETKKFEFVQVLHKVYDYVLCQVYEIERTDKDIAKCIVIGYKDEKGRIRPIRIPFDQNSEVLRAEDEFIKSVIKLEDSEKGAFIGRFENKNIDVKLDLRKLLTKHVAILAKSGAGKSYTVGVLIEEIIDKRVPILVIDPHGEYSTIKYPSEEDITSFGLKARGFKNIREYGDLKINNALKPLKLNNNLTPTEIVHLFPGKLSSTQMGILYSAVKHLDSVNFTNVLYELDKEENNTKWTLINNLEYLNNLEIFSEAFIPYNELIQPGICSIINLKGISPDVQEIIVYKLMKDLFDQRKKEKIPPFFTVIEEAHNYCPERSFGESRSSKILRTIASEGRKFGLGLCVVSQRPARVDKSVLSQCTTQIIMKVTNPNDLKAISNSVEGLTSESEQEIKNLPVGSALITGMVDMPLFVSIRPRMSKHGGRALEILKTVKDDTFFEKVEDFEKSDLLPIIKPKLTINDIKLMSDKEIENVNLTLVPAFLFVCSENAEYNVLIEAIHGEVVTNIDTFETKRLPELDKLNQRQIQLLQLIFKTKKFSESDLNKKGYPLNINNELTALVDKKFIEKTQDIYIVSNKYVMSHLSKYACYQKIEFQNIKYYNILQSKTDIDRVKEKLSKFTNIKDQRDCYVLKHDIIYKNGAIR